MCILSPQLKNFQDINFAQIYIAANLCQLLKPAAGNIDDKYVLSSPTYDVEICSTEMGIAYAMRFSAILIFLVRKQLTIRDAFLLAKSFCEVHIYEITIIA